MIEFLIIIILAGIIVWGILAFVGGISAHSERENNLSRMRSDLSSVMRQWYENSGCKITDKEAYVSWGREYLMRHYPWVNYRFADSMALQAFDLFVLEWQQDD